MRILIFHGYLLSGTGSNVYNARLAEALVRLGHEVHLFSQDRHPDRQPFVDAFGDWDRGWLELHALCRSTRELTGDGADRVAGCTVYRPNIGTLLPVYVEDRYEDMEARTFAGCTDSEIEDYIRANVEAVREVVDGVRPEAALANHLVMGPVILARALGGRIPYAVKVHGSALEYTVKPDRERFVSFAREGLEQARTVLVGSRHTAESLWEAIGDPSLERRTRLGPPGVACERFVPREPLQAKAALRSLAVRVREGSSMRTEEPMRTEEQASAFARDDTETADAIERLADGRGEMVAFVGKLIPAKGVDLLIAAWPLVLERRVDARLVLVGFGSRRDELEGLCRALAEGREEQIADRALPYLRAFMSGLDRSERTRYWSCARRIATQVSFTGRLDHDELADLLPACEALVVPSTFPEAFGMVAAEAAACGVLPIGAGHSGLAEVSDALARRIPARAASWLSFPVDDDVVPALADRVVGWLEADPVLKEQTRVGLVSVARERWSWEGVARGVIAAALGEPVERAFG